MANVNYASGVASMWNARVNIARHREETKRLMEDHQYKLAAREQMSAYDKRRTERNARLIAERKVADEAALAFQNMDPNAPDEEIARSYRVTQARFGQTLSAVAQENMDDLVTIQSQAPDNPYMTEAVGLAGQNIMNKMRMANKSMGALEKSQLDSMERLQEQQDAMDLIEMRQQGSRDLQAQSDRAASERQDKKIAHMERMAAAEDIRDRGNLEEEEEGETFTFDNPPPKDDAVGLAAMVGALEEQKKAVKLEAEGYAGLGSSGPHGPKSQVSDATKAQLEKLEAAIAKAKGELASAEQGAQEKSRSALDKGLDSYLAR